MKPYLILEWNDTETDANGWLCIYNFVKGYAGGGIRMHPSVTREEVERLATGMAYKYNACESVNCGGCKGGIVYSNKKDDYYDVLKRYIAAMRPYIDAGLAVGGDLGTSYDDVLKVFDELGMRLPQTNAQSKDPEFQQGIQECDRLLGEKVDMFYVNDATTGYGVAYATDEAWKCKSGKDGAKVVIQGFGCVGASCAYLLEKMGYKIVGISDANLLVTCQDGLNIEKLISGKNPYGEMDRATFDAHYEVRPNTEWLDVDCDILIPAALEDVINVNNANDVKASLIVEGANIPISPEGDKIIALRGIDVVPDFIANLGAIRFFDRTYFRLVEPTVEGVMKDIEYICRKNTRKLYEEAKKSERYLRDIAIEIFEPTIQGQPEI